MDDLEKFNFYCAAKFHVREGILFNDAVKEPTSAELFRLREKHKERDIENLYNHVHLSAITDDYLKQCQFAYELLMSWRKTLNALHLESVVKLVDDGNEVVVSVGQFKWA